MHPAQIVAVVTLCSAVAVFAIMMTIMLLTRPHIDFTLIWSLMWVGAVCAVTSLIAAIVWRRARERQ